MAKRGSVFDRNGSQARPTRLGSGIDKDRQDYTVYTGGWDIGRIYETRGGPEHLRWFWSFAVQGPMRRSDRDMPDIPSNRVRPPPCRAPQLRLSPLPT